KKDFKMKITTEDLPNIIENIDTEFKKALGKDGRGDLPESFWETYSAMANSQGGTVFLGIEEKGNHDLFCEGITDTDKVIKKIWDILNDRDKVSKNILTDKNINIIDIRECKIISVFIPKARRNDKPIYLNKTPMGNTFIRHHEGDYRVDDETVRRMMADSIGESRDDELLSKFSIEDLDESSIKSYRHKFSGLKPDHIWNNLDLSDFLIKIGAMGLNRDTNAVEIRKSGLLMFGKYEAIRDVYPYYMLDYQERAEQNISSRWIDRITPDGTWSGNLYDFFMKTIRKLTAEIKVPFELDKETRKENSSVHEALREALINTLIHADFTGRSSILIIKRPDMFGFRNPGLMRVSVEQAILGGYSDCRNRRIQDMFRYVGLVEQAGSGIPKIFKSWKEEHWLAPKLYEDVEKEQTLLEMKMVSLMPKESILQLTDRFGDTFRSLPELERLILITAITEGTIRHQRITELSLDHPKDISLALAHLVQNGFLEKSGETRGSSYEVKGFHRVEQIPPFDSLFQTDLPDLQSDKPKKGLNSPDLGANSPDLGASSPDLKIKLSEVLQIIGKKSLPKTMKSEDMKKIIVHLCSDSFVTLKELSEVLKRNPKSLQDQYISDMLKSNTLELKYPDIKNHPDQAYKSRKEID
ncbi:MAG: RNA-binding domain-containing protein, partial [bacterium]